MSTERCERLLRAYRAALARPARVLVLLGGPGFWSNGMDPNAIEAAPSPAGESLRSINTLDDVVREVVLTQDRLVVAALRGNAGAGGAFLALAADLVYARRGVVLNPHYAAMGGLHGSEYWTYLLPRRGEAARGVTSAKLPVGTAEAVRLGLLDGAFGETGEDFTRRVEELAVDLARDPALSARLEETRRRRAADERARPLEDYRRVELERMRESFYGFDPSHHVARYNFVLEVPKSRTPSAVALHRGRT